MSSLDGVKVKNKFTENSYYQTKSLAYLHTTITVVYFYM